MTTTSTTMTTTMTTTPEPQRHCTRIALRLLAMDVQQPLPVYVVVDARRQLGEHEINAALLVRGSGCGEGFRAIPRDFRRPAVHVALTVGGGVRVVVKWSTSLLLLPPPLLLQRLLCRRNSFGDGGRRPAAFHRQVEGGVEDGHHQRAVAPARLLLEERCSQPHTLGVSSCRKL